MTAPDAVPVLSGRPGPARTSTYRSGHCSIHHHHTCLGVYSGTDCTCWCHRSVTVRVWPEYRWECETCFARAGEYPDRQSAQAAADLHLTNGQGIAP
jgi:hypothetical protein